MEKLKPCPFCGGTAKLEDCNFTYISSTGISCTSCGAYIAESNVDGNGRHNRAVEKWNRRIVQGGGRTELNDNEFNLETISKTEFIDDYSFKDKKFLVTIWNVRVSVKALNDYIYSKLPSSDWEFEYANREEYDAAYNQCLNDRKQWEDNFKRLLDQAGKNIAITQAHAEFFTAIKIEKYKKDVNQ